MRRLPVLPRADGAAEGAEHLAFACTACGDCCRRYRVALTHQDLVRLARGAERPPASLVAWLPPDEVDLDAESASLVLLPPGPRLMVLAHAAGACVFLDADGRCGAYSSRPLDCRLYPFVLERDANQAVTRLSLFEAPCGELREVRENLDDIERADRERWAVLSEYRALVARWNLLARRRARFGHRALGEREFFELVARQSS